MPTDIRFGPFYWAKEVEMARDGYYDKWTSIGYKVELHINETVDDRGRRIWFVVGKRYSPNESR
mgnify:CR=1 FL=1